MNMQIKYITTISNSFMLRLGMYALIILMYINCTPSQKKVPNEVKSYLNEVLNLLEKKSVNRKSINWSIVRDSVFQKAAHANNIKQTYPAVTLAVSMLNDHHSYFRSVTEYENDTNNNPLPILVDELTPKDIGYIRIPFCVGTAEEINTYISVIQYKFKQQANLHVKGWIIDLRGNFGGNMWPMLLALEPLIGNGTLGYFVDADNKHESWKLKNGKAYINDTLIYENLTFEKLDLTSQYVAVITDNQTASSGEAISISFKCRNNTKSFGSPTFGVSTGCVSHQLSDGSIINLAESVFADRKMKTYGTKVHPDVETTDPITQSLNWIYSMNKN